MPKTERQYGTQKTTIPEGKTEYQRDYMRDYRREQQQKQQDLEEAMRVLAVQIETQVLSTVCNRLEKPVANYPLLKKERLHPTFLETVVEAVEKEFPKTGIKDEIRYEVKRVYEWAKLHPEETAANTKSAYQTVLFFRERCENVKVEDAEEWIRDDYRGFPKQEQITDKRERAGYFAECMRAIKPKGFGFYASREACGKRFLSPCEFWMPEWFNLGPGSMARSKCDLGPEFFALDGRGVRFVEKWMMEEREELRKTEDLKLEIAKGIYDKSEAWEKFEELVKVSIDDFLSDGEIMERVRKLGTDKIIDPTFLISQLPELRKEVIKEHEFRMDQKILRGIIGCKDDEKIVAEVTEEYNVHDHELRTRIRLLRKAMTAEVVGMEKVPELTKCGPRMKIKIKL